MTAASAVVVPQPQPKGRPLPESFVEALRLGWRVVGDQSTSTDERKRTGVVLLAKDGRTEQLSIPYTGTPKGYAFGTPQLAA